MKNVKKVISKKNEKFYEKCNRRPHPAEFNIFAPMVEIYNSLEG